MLFSEDLGGGHQCHLVTTGDGLQGSHCSDQGFTGADIALQ